MLLTCVPFSFLLYIHVRTYMNVIRFASDRVSTDINADCGKTQSSGSGGCEGN